MQIFLSTFLCHSSVSWNCSNKFPFNDSSTCSLRKVLDIFLRHPFESTHRSILTGVEKSNLKQIRRSLVSLCHLKLRWSSMRSDCIIKSFVLFRPLRHHDTKSPDEQLFDLLSRSVCPLALIHSTQRQRPRFLFSPSSFYALVFIFLLVPVRHSTDGCSLDVQFYFSLFSRVFDLTTGLR